MSSEIIKFEVNKTYATRSSCDWDCIYDFTILDRTEKMVKICVWGEIKRRKVYVYNGVEQFLPHGRHSMCAVISANRELKDV